MIDEMVKHPFFGTLMTILVVAIGYWITIRRNNNVDLKSDLDKKVDKEQCLSFKRRIGKESDDHSGAIEEIKDGLQTQTKAMIFLVTKQGGDPHQLGLM